MLPVKDEQMDRPQTRSFRSCVAEVARLLGGDAESPVEPRGARRVAAALRKSLLERSDLPEELFDPLLAAAVYDPDPSFCRWFVEPAVYVFGRRRVRAALVEYLRTGTDAERAGAVRAWYSAGIPLREGRSPAYAPNGTRDPALDLSQDAVEAWMETSMLVFAETSDLSMRHQTLLGLPTSPEDYPERLRGLLEDTLVAARTHPDRHIRAWAVVVDRRASELAEKADSMRRTDVGSC